MKPFRMGRIWKTCLHPEKFENTLAVQIKTFWWMCTPYHYILCPNLDDKKPIDKKDGSHTTGHEKIRTEQRRMEKFEGDLCLILCTNELNRKKKKLCKWFESIIKCNIIVVQLFFSINHEYLWKNFERNYEKCPVILETNFRDPNHVRFIFKMTKHCSQQAEKTKSPYYLVTILLGILSLRAIIDVIVFY